MERHGKKNRLPMRIESFRVFKADHDFYSLAASKEGVSKSEFIRRALRERTAKLLASD